MFNVDEMGFSLKDGDNGLTGRPGTVMNSGDVQNCGEASQKSSLKFTILAGMTFGDEALPPLFILPSLANFAKIRGRLLVKLNKVKGVYGYGKNNRRTFSAMVACSKKGSMMKEIL